MIYETKDYNKFSVHPSNGIYDEANYAKLLNSMRRKNMLEWRPIIVNPDFQVIDGKHRLRAAIELGIPISYQIKEDAVATDILDLQLQRRLKIADFLHFYINEGFVEYIKLKNWLTEKELDLPTGCTFLLTKVSTKNLELRNPMGDTYSYIHFKEGKYKFPDGEKLEKANKLLSYWRKILDKIYSLSATKGSKSFCTKSNFRIALVSFLKNPNLDINVFITKIELRYHLLRRCTTTAAYYDMFLELYNYGNRNPIEPYNRKKD